MAKKKEIEQPQELTFEERLARLQIIVATLESGDSPLEESVALYREGMGHSANCRQQLATARHDLEVFSNGQCEPLPSPDPATAAHSNADEDMWS